MAERYVQSVTSGRTHFSAAPNAQIERSKVYSDPVCLTTFNAGDIVPIFCKEMLPSEAISINLDSVVRQMTLLTPTMGKMEATFYAFFVPNRVVNSALPSVFGENVYGAWTANPVSLAPLLSPDFSGDSIQVPVGSVADYYGFSTVRRIPAEVLQLCHDLKFRGYVEIYNQYFRDQNYQPPIPYSKLNVYEGFMEDRDGSAYGLITGSSSSSDATEDVISHVSDNSVGAGALYQAIYGGDHGDLADMAVSRVPVGSLFNALGAPLKANKIHDYFTSGLPSPQKSGQVFIPVSGSLNIPQQLVTTTNLFSLSGAHPALSWRNVNGSALTSSNSGILAATIEGTETNSATGTAPRISVYPSNLVTTPTSAVTDGLAISVNDLRLAAATQQIYEQLALGGSRYREYVATFFGIEADNPYKDIPTYIGKITRSLDLYQTAQTSASETGNTPQGNLAAFGYTNMSSHLCDYTALEHGYLHVFVVVRHRNIYGNYLSRDNFRLSMLDFYHPQLANISEQPVYLREINPFASDANSQPFCYQEAWAEYRYNPDRVSGLMRPGVAGSLAIWNYADDYDPDLKVLNPDFLKSNSQEVLDRTLAVQSSLAPQFKGQFCFQIVDDLPMPTYSVPGLDIV